MVNESDLINLKQNFTNSKFLGKVGLTEPTKNKEGHFSIRTKDTKGIYNHNYILDQNLNTHSEPRVLPNAVHINVEEATEYSDEQLVDTGTEQTEMFDIKTPQVSERAKQEQVDFVELKKKDFLSPILDFATCRPAEAINDMEYLIDKDEFICPDKKITDDEFVKLLNGGKYKYLDLSYCSKITDFTALKNQTELLQLSLSGNSVIKNCSFLKDLTKLEVLDLGMTGITDISFLRNLTNLKMLNIKYTEVGDISPVSYLENLRDFTMMGCSQIGNLSALQHTKELRLLDINNALRVHDVSVVKHLNKIENLFFDYCTLESIESVRELYTLKVFSFSSKNLNIKNIVDTFKDLTELRFLNLRRAKLNDITGLKKLTKMIAIDLGYGNFFDLEPLAGMTDLRRAVIDENPGIVDISSLENLKKLAILDISGNRITDISVIKNFPHLTELSLSDNILLKDLTPIENLSEITEMSLDGCLLLSDIYPIRHNVELNYLLLNRCPRINDISVLRYLPNLIVVDLDSTSIPYSQISNLKRCRYLAAFTTIGTGENYRRAKSTFALRRKWNSWRKKIKE